VPVQWWRSDTLFFAAPLADSIQTDTIHTLRFRTSDLAGRTDSLLHRVEWDTTGADPLVLEAPAGPVPSPYFTLIGRWNERPNIIFLYQDGNFIESVLTNPLMDSLAVEVTLNLGENRFYVTAEDEVGNLGPPSNTITVEYVAGQGLDLPQPFRPDDEFQINTTLTMTRVRLYIYDLSGDMIVSFDFSPNSVNQIIPWDGLNGQGETVQRGPLVAVLLLDFVDGSTQTLREIFVFDP
jgi:hypothetical protein